MNRATPDRPAGRRSAVTLPGGRGRWALLLGGAIAVSALSLAFPSVPTTDPWGWIVWGHEVTGLGLDTSGGGAPSWKPGPVLVTAPLSLVGDGAPELWLVVARTGGLLALVFAYRLAARVAGPVAGVLAAVLLLLSTGWLRAHLHGYVEPSLVAILLAAVELHVSGRSRAVVALLFIAGLMRPEAWPALGAYGVWRFSAEPSERKLVAAALLATPLLWFGGDFWGSGDPLHGSRTAKAITERTGRSGVELLAPVLGKLELAAAGFAVVGALWARQRGSRLATVLAVSTLAWAGLLLVLVGLGYPASPRFAVLPLAGVSVLGGVGVVAVWRALGTGHLRSPLVAGGLVAVIAALVVPRVDSSAAVVEASSERAELQADLRRIVRTVPGGALECGTPVLSGNMRWNEGALAWELGLPLTGVRTASDSETAEMVHRRPAVVFTTRNLPPGAVSLARSRHWNVGRLPGSDHAACRA